MKKKKMTALVLSLLLVLSLTMPVSAAAPVGAWTTDANGVMTIDGTYINVWLSHGILHVDGFGEIPDYSPQTMYLRPWHNLTFHSIIIGSGITEVGSFAFADKPTLTKVTMPSTTFIKDSTSFANANEKVIFRINGITSAQKQFNQITYTSLESIAANSSYGVMTSYIMDNPTSAQTFREMNYPYMPYVYSIDDTTCPWQYKIDTTKGVAFQSFCRISEENPMGIMACMTGQIRVQGPHFMEAVSYFLGEYTYLRSYNMTLVLNNVTTYYTNGFQKYVLTLPAHEQLSFRDYRLIQFLPDGQVMYLDDLDQSDKTVTFSTFYPTGTYALVYKYDETFLRALLGY